MGKKGKMSIGSVNGTGKWSNYAELRDLSNSLKEARQHAYDQGIMEKKRLEDATRSRRRLIFPHLQYLIGERMRSDAGTNGLSDSQDNSWYRQQLLLFTKSDMEKFKATKVKIDEAQRLKFYKSLLPSSLKGTIPSLSSLCVEAAAKFAHSYDPDDIRYALSTVGCDRTELFSLYCCISNTQSDQLVRTFTHPFLEKIHLAAGVTDSGVEVLTSAIVNARNGKFQELDTWEMIDPTEINSSSCMDLREISLLGCNITQTALTQIGEHCLQLRRLRLHDVQFVSERRGVDPAIFCLRTLTALSEGYHLLCRLELLQCSWVSLEALRLWARHLQQQRQTGHKVLPALKELHLSLVEGDVTGRSHPALGSIPTGAVTTHSDVEATRSTLQELCGIALSLTRLPS
jgi:hypothetical protein